MNTKQYNHRKRIQKAARHGINELIACKTRYGSEKVLHEAKILADLNDDICREVVDAILEQFTIRNRVRK